MRGAQGKAGCTAIKSLRDFIKLRNEAIHVVCRVSEKNTTTRHTRRTSAVDGIFYGVINFVPACTALGICPDLVP